MKPAKLLHFPGAEMSKRSSVDELVIFNKLSADLQCAGSQCDRHVC